MRAILHPLAILIAILVAAPALSEPDRTAQRSAAAIDPFIRVTEGPPVSDGGWSFGVSWVDYDGDDYPDLYVNNNVFGSEGELNYLYHNEGNGTYTKVQTGPLAVDGGSVASTWADIDNDGDNDVYVSCFGAYNVFYRNQGNGVFTRDSTLPRGTTEDGTMEAEWVDYNRDGQIDLFVVNHRPPSSPAPIQCALYLNDHGEFLAQDNSAIGLAEDEGNSTAWGDYDNDGDRDLVWSRNEQLTLFFDNNGDGSFTPNAGIAVAQPPAKYHGNWADYDNDGDLDLFTGAGYPAAPCLLQNDGQGDFAAVTGQEIATDTGYWTGGHWGDYDNDGWLDLLIVGNYYYQPYPNRLYHNNGDGTFTRVTTGPVATDQEPSSAAAWADHDRDGDLDLFIANVNNANNTLYENLGNANHWLQIRLAGRASNRSGIGAKVRLHAVLSGVPRWQMREISAKNGFMSQGEMVAHFGLGDAASVDSLRIEWPSGLVDSLRNVEVDQFLVITEGQSLDGDVDGVLDTDDNCPSGYNPDQFDGDGDGTGDLCDGFNNCGDARRDQVFTSADIIGLVNFVFKSGQAPAPVCTGDLNGNGSVGSADIITLVNYVFKGGPPPVADCCLDESLPALPRGAPVTVDGVLAAGEWNDAMTRRFAVGDHMEITVMTKHDGSNLLAAWRYEFLDAEHLCIPEILIDVGNDKAGTWSSDDWWFHVSGTDCEAHGTYEVWNDCSVVQPDWEGVPNFALGPNPPILDTFEIRIPFVKLGIAAGDVIGLAFRAEYVQYQYGFWPPEAVIESPASWSTMRLEP